MSFLDRFRQSQQEPIHKDWKSLRSAADLDAAIAESYQYPVALFKHSTSCGISSMAKWNLEKDWDFGTEEVKFYYLDLLAFRPISNAIADQLNVIHQSPQVILLRNGEVIYHTSHHAIGVAPLRAALKS